MSGLLSVLLLIVAYNVKSDTMSNTYSYIQNCLIGIACSLVVVVITTYLQFLAEHKKVFYKYKRNLRKLYLRALCIKDSDKNDSSVLDLNEYRDSVDQCLEKLKECMQNLCWFSPMKNKRYNKSFSAIYSIIIDFYKGEYSNPQHVLMRLGEDSEIELLEKLIKESASNRIDNILVDSISKLREKGMD